MRAFIPWALMVLAVLGNLGSGHEPGPKKKPEVLPIPKQKEELPLPRVIPENLLFPYAPPHVPQVGTREVWQYYAVDSAGRFRPRVIFSPYGAYYAANGDPYPWTTTRPTLYMPYVSD